MTSPDDLNRTIDDVAREMTAGDASPNLRARVLADIESPRRFAWRPMFATACAAGAAIALLVVTLNRPAGPAAEPPARSAKASAPSAKEPALSAETPAGSPKAVVLPAGVLAASTSVPASTPNTFVEELLKEDPLVVDSIALTPINPESIAVIELPTITPIAVEPLGPGEQK